MNNRHPQFREEDLEAPAKFRDALRQLHTSSIEVPVEVDESMLKQARTHLGAVAEKAQKSRRADHIRPLADSLWAELVAGIAVVFGRKRWMALSATAVVVVAALVMLGSIFQPKTGVLAEDINRDGTVDMLDAFALARRLQQGQIQGTDLDLTGDGRVDEQDVQALAMHAVKLDPGRSS